MKTWLIFPGILAIRLLCAKYSIIPDCDEVFNYWEPTHFLTNGFGLQTWEYSPDYAIRSWAYIGIHALAIKILGVVVRHKSQLFFALRGLLAIACSHCEFKLYTTIKNNISEAVATSYLIFSMLSAGMFHASISFLPSTFAMQAYTLALSKFLDFRGDVNISVSKGILWTAIGGLLGWPFALVLALPFGLRYLIMQLYRRHLSDLSKTIAKVILSISALTLFIIAFDSIAYRQLQFVPLNIVWYNVFGGDDTGPNIFGTEPWWYYPLNLSINFNLVFILAVLSAIAPIFNPLTRINRTRLFLIISPFFLWLTIFIIQPHKEERFMYVVYPSLCLNAAIALETLLQYISKILGITRQISPQDRYQHKSRRSYLISTLWLLTIVTASLISLSRSAALAIYYAAPIDVFSHVPVNSTGNLCIGREWYRYPSSYFINDSMRLKFIKSGFNGLLPGEFLEDSESAWKWWNRHGIFETPPGMNNQNIEDISKYVPEAECDYVVDSGFQVDETIGEHDFVHDDVNWKKIYCSQFLDTGSSTGIARILWLPESSVKLSKSSLQWVDYCLLERR